MEGNNNSNSKSKVQSLVHRIEMKLQTRDKHPCQMPNQVAHFVPIRSERCQPKPYACEGLSESDRTATECTSGESIPCHCSSRS